MIDWINVFISILIPTALGYIILSILINKKINSLMKISLSYGLGMGLLAIWMLFIAIIGYRFNIVTIKIPLLLLVFCLSLGLLLRKKYCPSTKNLPATTLSSISDIKYYVSTHITKTIIYIILLCYIAHNIFFVFWQATNIPIYTWDALATIAFKAKIFYFEGRLPDLNLLPHKTYPLLVPFLETWVAINLGHWDDQLIKIIFPCAFISFLGIFYSFLRVYINKFWALIGSAILLSSNFFIYHATISYRDFFLMYYNCSTIMLLLLWNKTKIQPLLFLSSLFAGFATFTKLEGTAFLPILFLLFLIITLKQNYPIKNKIKQIVIFTIPATSICLNYHIYKITHNVVKSDKTVLEFNLSKLLLSPHIIAVFLRNMFLSSNWSIVWIIFFISLLRLKENIYNKKTTLFIILATLLFFAEYILVALFTTNYVWIAGDLNMMGLSRLLLHFYPLSVLTIIFLTGSPYIDKKHQDNSQ